MTQLEVEQIKTITQRLKTLRKREGLSQAAAAEALGIAKSTYSAYETGKLCLRLKMLMKLAVFYHTSLDYIAGRRDDDSPNW